METLRSQDRARASKRPGLLNPAIEARKDSPVASLDFHFSPGHSIGSKKLLTSSLPTKNGRQEAVSPSYIPYSRLEPSNISIVS